MNRRGFLFGAVAAVVISAVPPPAPKQVPVVDLRAFLEAYSRLVEEDIVQTALRFQHTADRLVREVAADLTRLQVKLAIDQRVTELKGALPCGMPRHVAAGGVRENLAHDVIGIPQAGCGPAAPARAACPADHLEGAPAARCEAGTFIPQLPESSCSARGEGNLAALPDIGRFLPVCKLADDACVPVVGRLCAGAEFSEIEDDSAACAAKLSRAVVWSPDALHGATMNEDRCSDSQISVETFSNDARRRA